MDMDLPLHRVDISDGGVIEVFAPDERGEFGQEFIARRDVAGTGPRLDHRRTFPVLADALVIAECRRDRDRHRRRTGIRPQPEIGPEHVTVRRPLLHDTNEPLDDLHEKLHRLDIVGQRRRIPVEQDDQVDVGGVVQFPRAMFAHGQDEQTGAHLRLGGIDLDLSARGLRPQQKFQRGRDRRVGEIGQRAGDVRHGPDLAEIGEAGQQRHFLLRLAQAPHHFGFVGNQIRGIARGGQHPVARARRIVSQKTPKPLGIGRRKVPEVRRALRDAGEQRFSWRARFQHIGEFRMAFDQPGRSSNGPSHPKRARPDSAG